VVTAKRGQGDRPTIEIGEVVGVLESVMYNGEGEGEPAGSTFFVDWENGARVDSLSWREYQQLREI
jgi:hypothetical protein